LEFNATWIQAGGQLGANIIAKWGSQQVYIIIPKSKEWLTINYIVKTTKKSLPRFYIFKRKKMHDDYIKLCKQGTCMVMQTKTWMTNFLFKKLLSFFKRWKPRWHFCYQYIFAHFRWTPKFHVTLQAIKQARAFWLDTITLPSHMNHALHPFNVVCFKLFETTFKKRKLLQWSIIITLNHIR